LQPFTFFRTCGSLKRRRWKGECTSCQRREEKTRARIAKRKETFNYTRFTALQLLPVVCLLPRVSDSEKRLLAKQPALKHHPARKADFLISRSEDVVGRGRGEADRDGEGRVTGQVGSGGVADDTGCEGEEVSRIEGKVGRRGTNE
jgi:hypothetical protein